ncbi:DUF305 domain-containing protein [Actinoplanes auranticolor]|uniref:DUF305 domain-containing protein n=1 Tax=Actinoplanes auranticolor TaxID=47988 RepID=A0A919SGI0_9ACTN|nr:DUF305 domain-containing protein [Actinoplanes auranticolor]GIM71977.1 hypothetical protein Aau02nite_48660 [Actinoplanes auranticolor]
MKGRPYATLAAAITVHFFVMWALTYSGVWDFDHIWLNLNRFSMAVAMVAPMIIVMVLAMWRMFPKPRVNVALLAVSALVFGGAFAAIRTQTFVGDQQLSRSMIPHHSIAIKTCERAQLTDPETVRLCRQIVRTQREEIAQMEAILARLDRAG